MRAAVQVILVPAWTVPQSDTGEATGPDIREGLNIAAILPHLVKHGLTTSEERELLLSSNTTTIEKKNKLIYLWLPHKGNNSLTRFMEALKDSIKEESTHESLACKIQDKRNEEYARIDSGVEAPDNQHSSSTCHSCCSKSQDENSSQKYDDDTGEWELMSSGSGSEDEILQDVLQRQYTKVMGPKGVAKIADKVAVGEFRLFCFNITRTAEDYSRMGSECSRSNDVWCRVSMNCNLCHFTPLESICQHFSSSSDDLKLIKEYKSLLSDKVYEPVRHKIKPNEGYQPITKPRELFASCIVTIASSLDERIADKKIRLEDMKSYFCTLKKSSVDHEQELLITNKNMQDNINKAKDVFFLLFAISPCWDCINFLFLEEHVVKQFGGDEERREIEGYKHCLKNRWLSRPVKEYPDMTHELTCFEDSNEVTCRINAEWDTTKIRQVLRLKKVIASVYNVDLSAVKLCKVYKGSIFVQFILPSSCITEISDENVLLLAKHHFLDLVVDNISGNINPTYSCNIAEKFATLDNTFQIPIDQSLSKNELCSNVLLVEKVIKDSTHMLSNNDEPKMLFKHLASYYIVLQTFATSSKLNVYHNASNHIDGKGLIYSWTLYGIEVQMKSRSEKGEPCALEITQQNSLLTILFETQAEAQQWFIALKHITGWFHLNLKISPPNLCIPEDLVVQVEGDSMVFWSVVDDSKCMEWKLSDINSVHLKNALYIYVKSLSNTLLEEDMYVFEGQQLEKLYDLIEEYKSALTSNFEYENTDLHTEKENKRDNYESTKHQDTFSHEEHKSSKQLKRTLSSSSFEESDSQTSSPTNDYDILSEILIAEQGSTMYHAFSWKVKEEIQLQDKTIQLIKTSWYDVVSKYILNKGYRIIVTITDQETRILAEEKNNKEGKKRIQNRWKIIVQAVKKVYTIFEQPPCTKELGHFQKDSVVVATSEVHDFKMPHFQNVYYGTVKSCKLVQGSLQTGMAQCTIPPEKLKEMYSNLSKNKFWLKLWPSSALNTSINVSYVNEIEHYQFKESLDDAKSCPRNSEVLLYVPRSSKSFAENLVQTSQLAVDLGFSGKVVVFNWCTESCITSIDQVAEKVKPQLLQFVRMLYSHATKVHIVAVHDAALLVMKLISSEIEFNLGQVIFTRLASLSSSIFDDFQKLVDKDESFPFQADNVTIYHHPKSFSKSLLPIRSSTYGTNDDIFSKKTIIEPPPFFKNVDIICLGRHQHNNLMKNREYAVNKIIIEDMSEIVCFGKSIIDRSSRIKFQCGCRELKPPVCRSRLTCTLCNCTCYFVLGCVIGLGNFTPSLLKEMQQSLLQKHDENIIKCTSVSIYIRT